MSIWVLLVVVINLNGEPTVAYTQGFRSDVECLKVAKQKTSGKRASSACILIEVEK